MDLTAPHRSVRAVMFQVASFSASTQPSYLPDLTAVWLSSVCTEQCLGQWSRASSSKTLFIDSQSMVIERLNWTDFIFSSSVSNG